MSMYLSIVSPVFDEQECIEDFVREVCETMDRAGKSFELICVDDGSTDGTVNALRALGRRFPALRAVALDAHRGKSAALKAGIAAARGRLIALIDADLQNDPADLLPMISLLDSGQADCVVGVRKKRLDSWLRRLSSRIANWVARKITRSAGRDGGCGLNVTRSEIIKELPLFEGAHRFVGTLAAGMTGAQVREVLVNHRPRLKGVSKYGSGLGRTFVALRDALGVRWMVDRRLQYKVREVPGLDIGAGEARAPVPETQQSPQPLAASIPGT
jgi:dolichol-phosphate mannosyltransferase